MGNACVGNKKKPKSSGLSKKRDFFAEPDIQFKPQQASLLQEILNIQNNAKVFIQQSKNQKAIELYQLSLQTQKVAKLDKSFQYAVSLDKKGELLFLMAKMENNLLHAQDAVGCYQQSRNIKKAFKIQDSASYVSTLHNMGHAFDFLNQREKAITVLDQGIQIVERNCGRQNQNYYELLNSKAGALLGLKQYEKALQNYNQVLQFLQKFEHQQTKKIQIFDVKLWGLYMDIGSVYIKKGDLQTGLKYYFKSLGVREAKGGKHSIYCFEVLKNIVEVYRAKKDQENCKKYLAWIREIQNKKKAQ